MSDSETAVGGTARTSGAYTMAEIFSQPAVWGACLDLLEKDSRPGAISKRFRGKSEWVFIGCGSSYYIALAAASSMQALTGLRARAVPASEVLLYPDLAVGASKEIAPVLISRSGRTSEVLRAADLLNERGIDSLAVTCTPGEALEQKAAETLVLPPANEQSMVMTRSFTSMLLGLQVLAATLGGNRKFIHALRELPAAAERAFRDVPKRVREFVAAHQFADYIALAQGPFFGLACEAALKMTEMSVSYGQSFHTLEFRHGPKSIVSRETLLVFLLSETSYRPECEVLEEMKALGGTTLVVCNRADTRTRASADLLVELDLDLPELARLAPYLFAAQLTGLYTGLKKGLDPDHPRNLSRVVELEEHAAL